ncbi:hypothetical protein L6164_001090 [Bauhinia variegata]|uniref:Uncharacterized protein n=1 Tax=Bauhinia variegata TaxID=167791 RepID=A0ACB9QAP0_BAUVA|nr:hypothetical protein L6164_001090 [Bauhinia variegata]
MCFYSQFLFHFALLIILIMLKYLSSQAESFTASITTDKEALISFKSQLSSDSPHPLSSWDQNSSPCNWTGVFCNNLDDNRVIALNLSGLGLSGPISPHIGNLSFLESLQLQNNQITGAIPDQIGNLFRLRILNMNSNRIQGKLPYSITNLTQLQLLDLSSNQIVSQIPEAISLLTKLQVLKFEKNKFYGTIPPSLANISSLTNISFGTNTLSGEIPSNLVRLNNLIELDFTINSLTGTVPDSLYNISSLVNLALASNDLWGEIPQDIDERLPKLLVFNICFNKFRGNIPASLHNLTNIRVIRMASNFLQGTVPPGLGNLPFLQMYNIGFNEIVSSGESGLEFITSLTNSTQLNFLAIDGNQLEGVIPEKIGNLSKVLSSLYMGGNKIYGPIPASISHLSGLKLLNLSYNSISGRIPSELGELVELQELSLAGNQISGSIPESLGSLKKLNEIDLSGNELSGQIPVSFGNFQSLISMDLSNNKLTGTIPKEIINLPTLSSSLNLSKNFLSGSLPEFGIVAVATIDLSNNQLSGSLPSSIKNCLSLEKLVLVRNMFSGSIPQTLEEVRGLVTLDLSSNFFSGFIPTELENLKALQFLNLSYNDLEGSIPSGGVFQNLSAVHLEGNKKLCFHFPCLSKDRGRNLVWVYVIIAVFLALMLCFIIVLVMYMKKRKPKVIPAPEQLKSQHFWVSYDELRLATGNFSEENLIGSGSFGSVYKGQLSQGIAVAVKVLDVLRTGSLKSFNAECEALRNLRHRNLVKLITSCSGIDFKCNEFLALVYEFLCNGSLEDWINGRRKHSNGNGLSLKERLKIAIDVASALEYLHHDSEISIVHCDLKPSNILIDEDMTAKLGDFGLARLLIERSDVQASISSTHVLRGSIGYIPPEYSWGEKPSTAGDVYSFGIVLLELFTGKSPTNDSFTGSMSLNSWVKSAFPHNIEQVIDPKLLTHEDADADGVSDDESAKNPNLQLDCLASVLRVGLSCIADSPDGRINMRDVVRKLNASKEILLKGNNIKNPRHDYFEV